MLNDIFYFINNEERTCLRSHLNDLEDEKTVTILKVVDSKAESFNEVLLVFDSKNEEKLSVRKEQGLFDRLVLDRPYEVDITRI